jgi:hypothetical protein
MEVLISVFVLSIGLLGLAALLPVGSYTILETIKAERAGDCGRAALRDVKVRQIVNWAGSPNANIMSYVIDPLGVANGTTLGWSNAVLGLVAQSTISGGSLARTSLPVNGQPMSLAQAQAIFVCPDDLVVTLPELMSPAQPFGRSRIYADPVADPMSGLPRPSFSGDYSWFLTVTRPSYPGTNPPSTQIYDPTRARVSVVVCYKRDFGPQGGPPAENAAPVKQFYDQSSNGNTATALSGGSILLSRPIEVAPSGGSPGIRVRENDWVALYSATYNGQPWGLCSWYRVVAISDTYYDTVLGAYTQKLTLNGPDWVVTGQDYVVAIGQSVLGVYTTTVELDTDPAWQQ